MIERPNEMALYDAMSTWTKRSAVARSAVGEATRSRRRLTYAKASKGGGGRISGTMHVPTSRNGGRQGEGTASVPHAGFLLTKGRGSGACILACGRRFASAALQAPPAIRTASALRNGRVSLDLATEGISGSIADRLTLGVVPRRMPVVFRKL